MEFAKRAKGESGVVEEGEGERYYKGRGSKFGRGRVQGALGWKGTKVTLI